MLLNTGIIENERATLLPFDHQRLKELHKIALDPIIWKYMGMQILDRDEFDSYISSTMAEMSSKLSIPFLIVDKRHDKVAGSTRFGHINKPNKRCEIGWTWLGKDFQGKGLNKAVKHLMLQYGFEELGFNRIQFSADIDNLKSQRAIEKLGATKEGVFRNNYINENGESRTDVCYSIIKEEWKNIETNFLRSTYENLYRRFIHKPTV